MSVPTREELPSLPRDEEEPVFKEPWEAQAFAITLRVYDGKHFTWPEWAECLAVEIEAAQQAGDPDLGDTYYHYWLAALEKLLLEKSVLDSKAVKSRIEQWRRAYLNTPHGQPIELSAGQEPANT